MKSLLLHTCCAPCISHVYEILKDTYSITSFFFNPNIAPLSEYRKRLHELDTFAALKGFPVVEGPYIPREWVSRVKEYRFLGERSRRCWECYRLRLEKTFQYARDRDFNMVASVLSISPHKDADMINAIGRELEKHYRVPFLEANFKKNNGFAESVKLSKHYGFYRQDYCGCVYSRLERDRNSPWVQKSVLMRTTQLQGGNDALKS